MNKIKTPLLIISILWLIISYIWVFLLTPSEVNQGFSQKIMYIHVPAVLTSYFAIFILFIFSIVYILSNKKIYDQINLVSGEIAVLFLAISLITGSIWGKPTWNTYWIWDARLTIALITFIYFCGYLLFRKLSNQSDESYKKGSAIIAIFGFISVPLNHLAVKWFNSLHQGTTIFRDKPLIDPVLYYPLINCIFLFINLFITMLIWRIIVEQKKEKYFINFYNQKN